jgi:hypothetical protein
MSIRVESIAQKRFRAEPPGQHVLVDHDCSEMWSRGSRTRSWSSFRSMCLCCRSGLPTSLINLENGLLRVRATNPVEVKRGSRMIPNRIPG